MRAVGMSELRKLCERNLHDHAYTGTYDKDASTKNLYPRSESRDPI